MVTLGCHVPREAIDVSKAEFAPPRTSQVVAVFQAHLQDTVETFGLVDVPLDTVLTVGFLTDV